MATTMRIILVGKTEQIGRSVVEGLKPEYQVSLFCTSIPTLKSALPHVLARRAPPDLEPGNIGSLDFTTVPRAIVFGGAWDVDTAQGVEAPGVALLFHDKSKPSPPLGPEYAAHVMGRTRDALASLGGKKGVVMY